MRMDIEQNGQRFDLPTMTKFGENSSSSSNGLTNGLHNSLTDHNDHLTSGASQQSEVKMPFDPSPLRHRSSASTIDVSKLSLLQREKRCRNYERETNELRDTICSMQHQIHLLTNIKRVSRDYIRSMHELLRVTLSQECNQIEQLQLEVRELENELQHWERKHNLISTYQQSVQNTSPAGHNNPSWSEVHELAGHTSSVNNHHDSDDSHHQIQHQHVRRSQSSILSTASQDAPPLLPNPSELCEMSLEAMLDDSVEYQHEASEQTRAAAAVAAIMNPVHSATSSPVIAAALAAATAASSQDQFGLTPNQINIGQQATNVLNSSSLGNSGNKTLYQCDVENCTFATPLRQRLSMHKKLHNGEILYSCDVPGCDYQSNYKGNIKIHKKHKHKNLEVANASESQTESESPGFERWVNVNGVYSGEFNAVNRKGRKRKMAIYGQMEEEVLDHSGSESREAEGSFECQMQGCTYRTKWKHCLTAHQFAHTGVKPFACDFPGCNYRTNYKNAVKVHQRVHQRTGSLMAPFESQPIAASNSNLNDIIIKEEPLSLGADETEEDEEEEMDEAKEDSEEEVTCHLVPIRNGGANSSFGSPIGPISS